MGEGAGDGAHRDVQHVRVTAGEGRLAVTLEAQLTEAGVSAFAFGGDLPHVGGSALAAPGPELHDKRLSRADVWSVTVPGHKDAEAARVVARKLVIALGQPVNVSCGIHVDDASTEDLAAIGANLDVAADLLVERCIQLEDGADAAEGELEVADEDQLVLVDLLDHELGSCGKLEAHRRGLLHRAFSVVLLDGDQVLMTRRAQGKYHSGGLWTNACCSHPRAGEDLGQAVVRRLEQELGVSGAICREAGTYCYRAAFDNGLTEYELDHVFVGEWRGTCSPDPSEVMDVRWQGVGELVRDVGEHPERYTAWLPGVMHVALGGRLA